MDLSQLHKNFLKLSESERIQCINEADQSVINNVVLSVNSKEAPFLIESFTDESQLSDAVLQAIIFRASDEAVRNSAAKIVNGNSVFHELISNPFRPLATHTLMGKLDGGTKEALLSTKSNAECTPLELLVIHLFSNDIDYDAHISFLRGLEKTFIKKLFELIKSHEYVKDFPQIKLAEIVDVHQKFFSALLHKLPEIALTDFVYLFYFEADFIVAIYPDIVTRISKAQFLKTGYTLIDIPMNWAMNYHWNDLLSEQAKKNDVSAAKHESLFDLVAQKDIVKTILEYSGNEYLFNEAKMLHAEKNPGLLLTKNLSKLNEQIIDEKYFEKKPDIENEGKMLSGFQQGLNNIDDKYFPVPVSPRTLPGKRVSERNVFSVLFNIFYHNPKKYNAFTLEPVTKTSLTR